MNLGVLRDGCHLIADFSNYKNEAVKIEVKYAILLMMKEKTIRAYDLNNIYSTTVKLLGNTVGSDFSVCTLAFENAEDTAELDTIIPRIKPLLKDKYAYIKRNIIRIITELYDEREEIEKDVWYARKIPGTTERYDWKSRSPIEASMQGRPSIPLIPLTSIWMLSGSLSSISAS